MSDEEFDLREVTSHDVVVLACRLNGEKINPQTKAFLTERNVPSFVWEPYEGEMAEDTCKLCDKDIWIGPRQQLMVAAAQEAGRARITICLICATFLAQKAEADQGQGSIAVRHLGGD